jgi:hypothetical protein
MRCIFSTERDPPTYEYSQLPVLNLAATAAEKIVGLEPTNAPAPWRLERWARVEEAMLRASAVLGSSAMERKQQRSQNNVG